MDVTASELRLQRLHDGVLVRLPVTRRDQAQCRDQRVDHDAGEDDDDKAFEPAFELERFLPFEVSRDVEERNRVGELPARSLNVLSISVSSGTGPPAKSSAPSMWRSAVSPAKLAMAKTATVAVRMNGSKRPKRSRAASLPPAKGPPKTGRGQNHEDRDCDYLDVRSWSKTSTASPSPRRPPAGNAQSRIEREGTAWRAPTGRWSPRASEGLLGQASAFATSRPRPACRRASPSRLPARRYGVAWTPATRESIHHFFTTSLPFRYPRVPVRKGRIEAACRRCSSSRTTRMIAEGMSRPLTLAGFDPLLGEQGGVGPRTASLRAA